jgi:lysophospholipase L1-like esterase
MFARLAILAAAALVAARADPAPCRGDSLCNAEALRLFLDKLTEFRPGEGRSLHILQIGDSHTAGDMISEAWRRRLQARFGNGGRGVLAAGRPYRGYLTWRVTAAQSAGWTVNATFGPDRSNTGSPLGLAGFTQSTQHSGETLSLSADAPDQWFDRLTICALARSGGATVRLRLGDDEESWQLEAPGTMPVCRTLDSRAPARFASLTTTDDGPISITSIATFRRSGGAIVSNLGVSGAQLSHFGRTGDAILAAELAAYRPDLVVLAFGTNEGFSPILSADEAEAVIREQVARIRRLTPVETPILLLGAPDAAMREPPPGAIACGHGWFVPRLLETVRERQAALARELGLGFWNWADAMGGRCSALSWRAEGLMRADHVHFTRAGGERIGALLDAAIMRAAQSQR